MVYVMIYNTRWKNNGIVSTHEVGEKWTTEKESIIILLKDYTFFLIRRERGRGEREREREREREKERGGGREKRWRDGERQRDK